MLYLNLFFQIVAYIANKWLTVTNYTCIPIIERLLKTEATPKKYKLFKNISTITLQIMEHLMNSYSHELTVYVLGTCRLPYNLYLASNSVSSINLIPFQHCLREMSLPLGRVFLYYFSYPPNLLATSMDSIIQMKEAADKAIIDILIINIHIPTEIIGKK